MHTTLKTAAGCLVAVFAIAPALAFAQTGKQDVQAPRDDRSSSQSDGKSYQGSDSKGMSDRGMSSSEHKGMSRDSSAMSGSKDRVRQAQEALKSQGQDPGPVDGVMGPQTKQALRDYQKSQSLTVTGRLDDKTAEKLGMSSR